MLWNVGRETVSGMGRGLRCMGAGELDETREDIDERRWFGRTSCRTSRVLSDSAGPFNSCSDRRS